MKTLTPSLALIEDTVSAKVLDAMRVAAAQLSRLGVRHWLVGGLAVGAHGYPRATKDVDFLVGNEAFEHHGGGLVTMRPGVPIQVNGVLVDHLSALDAESFLTEGLPPAEAALTVAPIEVLVYLKLKSPRAKDRADIIELLKAGADQQKCATWLKAHTPSLVAEFEELTSAAAREAE